MIVDVIYSSDTLIVHTSIDVSVRFFVNVSVSVIVNVKVFVDVSVSVSVFVDVSVSVFVNVSVSVFVWISATYVFVDVSIKFPINVCDDVFKRFFSRHNNFCPFWSFNSRTSIFIKNDDIFNSNQTKNLGVHCNNSNDSPVGSWIRNVENAIVEFFVHEV